MHCEMKIMELQKTDQPAAEMAYLRQFVCEGVKYVSILF